MRVFKIQYPDEYGMSEDYICGQTLLTALSCYLDDIECHIHDLNTNNMEVIEVQKKEWKNIFYRDNDSKEWSVKDYIESGNKGFICTL